MPEREDFPPAIQRLVDACDFNELHENKLRVQRILEQARRNIGVLSGAEESYRVVEREFHMIHRALLSVTVTKRVWQLQDA